MAISIYWILYVMILTQYLDTVVLEKKSRGLYLVLLQFSFLTRHETYMF